MARKRPRQEATPAKPGFLLGHEPMGLRPNVRSELRRIRRDPMGPLLDALGGSDRWRPLFCSLESRYQDAYWFYYLSAERYLRAMSVAARYSRLRDSRGSRRFTLKERVLADAYRHVARFLEYDLVNLLIHSRILLDRVAGLSRRFLAGPRLPSFTSFSDHKKWFCKDPSRGEQWPQYAERIRNQTDWFDMPIKEVRDKFVVHTAPNHMRFLGYPSDGFELDLMILIPDRDSSTHKIICVNALRLTSDIETFLSWFCSYALTGLGKA